MYKLHLDLVLTFPPLMHEHAEGIVVARVIELPFPPYEDLSVFSAKFDECPDPMGFGLKEVVWDVDRQVFLASTYYSSNDVPLTLIPHEVRRWLDLGWEFGSYRDAYAPDSGDEADSADEPPMSDGPMFAPEPPENLIHQLPASRRPNDLNRFMKAMVRQMAETLNNSDVAYAIDVTGRYFSEEEMDGRKDEPAVAKWLAARESFDKLTYAAQQQWRAHTAKYPTIVKVLNKRPKN